MTRSTAFGPVTPGTRPSPCPEPALWHVSWLDKDDSIDWQAYFHARNRIVAALLHSPYDDGGLLTRDSKRWDLKHLLSMQYYPVTLRHRALRDILSGPEHMQRGMATILGELRAAAADFPEKVVLKNDDEMPRTVEGKRVYPVPTGTVGPKGPRGIPLVMFTARMTAKQWLTKPAPAKCRRAAGRALEAGRHVVPAPPLRQRAGVDRRRLGQGAVHARTRGVPTPSPREQSPACRAEAAMATAFEGVSRGAAGDHLS